MPRWNTISISGYHIREAGSTAAQELAFTLCNGRAYVRGAIDAGLDVDRIAPFRCVPVHGRERHSRSVLFSWI